MCCPDNSRNNHDFDDGMKECHVPPWSKRTRLELAFHHLSLLVSVTFLDRQTQEPRWLVNEISITKRLFLCFLLLLAVSLSLLMLVSSLCCSISAVKQTLKARCRNAAMSWDELVLCFERRLCPRSASGPVGENSANTLRPVAALHSWISHMSCFNFSSFFFSHFSQLKLSSLHLASAVTEASCWCWVFRLCLSIKVACWLVFYPGGPVSMCRHVSVPPISDCALILYMNYSFVELD